MVAVHQQCHSGALGQFRVRHTPGVKGRCVFQQAWCIGVVNAACGQHLRYGLLREIRFCLHRLRQLHGVAQIALAARLQICSHAIRRRQGVPARAVLLGLRSRIDPHHALGLGLALGPSLQLRANQLVHARLYTGVRHIDPDHGRCLQRLLQLALLRGRQLGRATQRVVDLCKAPARLIG